MAVVVAAAAVAAVAGVPPLSVLYWSSPTSNVVSCITEDIFFLIWSSGFWPDALPEDASYIHVYMT